MKTYSVRSTLVISILLLYILVSTTGCKKTSSNSPTDSSLSFTYNGIQYVLPYKEGLAEWGLKNSGIYIYRPDLFKGTINYPYANCAYLEPNDISTIQLTTNCQLTNAGGMPIDSVAVYLYQSGSVNISYINCSTKSEYDVYSGSTILYEVCDAVGTFDLILKNKENKTITITEGKLEAYRFRK